jgi:hypothetical protein
VNRQHGLEEEEHKTFYSSLLEAMGFIPEREKLKVFVRQYLYILLALLTLFLQIGLHVRPLLF